MIGGPKIWWKRQDYFTDNSLNLFVKSGKHGTKSLCSAHLQDVTSKTVPKNYTQAQWGSKLKFQAKLDMNWVSCWVSSSCIAWRSPHLINFLTLCLHLHFLSHVYLYACNGYGLHNFGNSNNLMPCITLEILVFQRLEFMLAKTSLVLAYITLEVLIVLCLSSPYNLLCFNAFRRHFQGLEKRILRNTISSQIL